MNIFGKSPSDFFLALSPEKCRKMGKNPAANVNAEWFLSLLSVRTQCISIIGRMCKSKWCFCLGTYNMIFVYLKKQKQNRSTNFRIFFFFIRFYIFHKNICVNIDYGRCLNWYLFILNAFGRIIRHFCVVQDLAIQRWWWWWMWRLMDGSRTKMHRSNCVVSVTAIKPCIVTGHRR